MNNTVTITVCLACADGDHHTCYGTNCECYCGGERVGMAEPSHHDTEVRAIRTLRAEGLVLRYVIDGRYLPYETALDALELQGYSRIGARGLLVAAEAQMTASTEFVPVERGNPDTNA